MIAKCTYCEHERGKQKENHSLFISHIVQWPIVLVAREDLNQRTSAELETQLTKKSPEKSKQFVSRPKMPVEFGILAEKTTRT